MEYIFFTLDWLIDLLGEVKKILQWQNLDQDQIHRIHLNLNLLIGIFLEHILMEFKSARTLVKRKREIFNCKTFKFSKMLMFEIT